MFNFLSSLPLSLPELFTFEISDLGSPNLSMSLVSFSQISNGRIASELVSLIYKIHDSVEVEDEAPCELDSVFSQV